MSDDLVKRVAQAWASMDGKPYGNEEAEAGGYTYGYDADAEELLRRSRVADRIEALQAQRNFAQRQVVAAEVKLAKAVGALEKIDRDFAEQGGWCSTARNTLAELKGECDE